VAFGNAAQTNTTATFSAPGVYTLELSAADGVHVVAYDAAAYTATSGINLSIAPAGTNVILSWTGGTAPFVVQETGTLPAGSWSTVVTTNAQSVSLPMTNSTEFFRIQGQ
jgi:PKD repeat protein